MSSDSESDSEGSLASAVSKASSTGSAGPSVLPPRRDARRSHCSAAIAAAELTKLRLRREQRLRRMLSQRHLAQPETLTPNALFGTRAALAEDDVVWLYALTNSGCFERLLAEVQSTAEPLAGHLDAVLSNANPLFYFNYRMPIEEPASANGDGATAMDGAGWFELSALPQRWQAQTAPIRRRRLTSQEREEVAALARKSSRTESATGGGQGRARTRAAPSSASSGMVAQSLQAWEAHLAASLTKEGETIENFRLARAKSSYTEKKSFQQQAEWREFQREVALQQQQRNREATRALRRGEKQDA